MKIKKKYRVKQKQMSLNAALEHFVLKLYEYGGIQFGSFPVRHDNKPHPMYVDLRICMAHPELTEMLARLFEGPVVPTGMSSRRLGAYSVFSDRVGRTDGGRLPTPAERVVAEIRRLLEEDCPHLLRQDN